MTKVPEPWVIEELEKKRKQQQQEYIPLQLPLPLTPLTREPAKEESSPIIYIQF